MNTAKPQAAECSPFEQVIEMLRSLQKEVGDIRAILHKQRKDQYTVDEIADMTGAAAYTVRRWIKEKRISAIRVTGTGPKGRLLIPHAELEKLIGSAKGGNVPAVAV